MGTTVCFVSFTDFDLFTALFYLWLYLWLRIRVDVSFHDMTMYELLFEQTGSS